MDTTAPSFTLRKNAKRAAEAMIRKGIAPGQPASASPVHAKMPRGASEQHSGRKCHGCPHTWMGGTTRVRRPPPQWH